MIRTERHKHYWLGENLQHHRGEGTIIKMSSPRCFIQFNIHKAYYSDINEFYREIAVVQWFDSNSPTEDEQITIMVEAWEFLAIEQELLESDNAHLTNLNNLM